MKMVTLERAMLMERVSLCKSCIESSRAEMPRCAFMKIDEGAPGRDIPARADPRRPRMRRTRRIAS